MGDNEEAGAAAFAVMEAAIGGMLVHLRPMFEARIRSVLGDNAALVDQSPPALDHLTGELFEAFFAPAAER